jgi:hypothetical protein
MRKGTHISFSPFALRLRKKYIMRSRENKRDDGYRYQTIERLLFFIS